MHLPCIKTLTRTFWRLPLTVLLGFGAKASAISEQNYKADFDANVAPFFQSQGEEGTLQTSDGVTLAYKAFVHPDSVGDLVFLQGWTESYVSYPEFAYDMYQNKVSIYFLDWRGQGKSQRALEDTYKSYVEDYKEYVLDLEAFMEQVVKPRAKTKPIALAFSMGANVLSIFETQYPQTFSRVILISPMLDIKSDPWPQRVAWSIARFVEILGFGDSYLFGQGPPKPGSPRINRVTSSEQRFDQLILDRNADPKTVLSGGTFSWLRASFEATWFMRDHAEQLTVPILMFQSGKDEFVRTEGQDYVCARAPVCLKIVIPVARHAILLESDRIRNKVMAEIMDFILNGY